MTSCHDGGLFGLFPYDDGCHDDVENNVDSCLCNFEMFLDLDSSYELADFSPPLTFPLSFSLLAAVVLSTFPLSACLWIKRYVYYFTHNSSTQKWKTQKITATRVITGIHPYIHMYIHTYTYPYIHTYVLDVHQHTHMQTNTIWCTYAHTYYRVYLITVSGSVESKKQWLTQNTNSAPVNGVCNKHYSQENIDSPYFKSVYRVLCKRRSP